VYGAWRGCGDAGSKGLCGKRYLAELAGIGKNTVNRLEKIHTEPHLTTIRKLAAALALTRANCWKIETSTTGRVSGFKFTRSHAGLNLYYRSSNASQTPKKSRELPFHAVSILEGGSGRRLGAA
jgi:transcriptional regulator with XRE-family HTH domain